jgi:hypothetical protein
MKLVKFNVSSTVHMIPDELYQEYCSSIRKLKYEKFTDYCNRIKAGSEFEVIQAPLGSVIEIPDWYFEAYKNNEVSVGVSFDKYKDKTGQRRAYKMEEALMHGDVRTTETMRKVKVFELVEEIGDTQLTEVKRKKA